MMRNTTLTDEQLRNLEARVMAIQALFNEYGRGNVDEHEFLDMYMRGTLWGFIKDVYKRRRRGEA